MKTMKRCHETSESEWPSDEEEVPALIKYEANPFVFEGQPWSWAEAEGRYKDLQADIDEEYSDAMKRRMPSKPGRSPFMPPNPYEYWFMRFSEAIVIIVQYFYPKYSGVDTELPEFRDLSENVSFIETLEVRRVDPYNPELSGCQLLHEALYNISLGGNCYRWGDEFVVMFCEVVTIIDVWKARFLVPNRWAGILDNEKRLLPKAQKFADTCDLVQDMVRGYGKYGFNPDFVVDPRLGGESRLTNPMTTRKHCALPEGYYRIQRLHERGWKTGDIVRHKKRCKLQGRCRR